METQNKPVNQYRSLGLKILSGAGFILVLVFGAWGVIQVGRSLPQLSGALSTAATSLTSIFVPAERLSITIPSANINSGEAFTLSWEHTNKRSAGTYTVTFACRDGLSVQTINAMGVYQSIPCNTASTFENTATEMRLVATSDNAHFLDVPFTVQFIRLSDGTVAASTQTTLTITNTAYAQPGSTLPTTAAPTQPTPTATTPSQTTGTSVTTPAPSKPVTPKPTPVYTYTVVGPVSNPNGNPDLAVTILDAGTTGTYYGGVYSNSTVRKGDTVVVRFVVENVGNKMTDFWNFNAVLPTMPMDIYSSDMQPPLMPGDKMQYTIQFDKADPGPTGGAFTINVDPSNMIWNEISKNNNVAKVYLTILN